MRRSQGGSDTTPNISENTTPNNSESNTLTHLDLAPSPDLFGIDPFNERNPKERVVTALDTINARYGLNTVVGFPLPVEKGLFEAVLFRKL